MEHITVIIPTLNNSNGVNALLNALVAKYPSINVIVVDDGSTVEHWRKLTEFKDGGGIQKIRLAKNFGQHSALLAAFSRVKTQWCITMDDDHLELVDQIPTLVEAAQDNNNVVVYGLFKVKRSLLRHLLSRVYRMGSRLVGVGYGKGSGFRLLPASILNPLVNHSSDVHFIDERIRWYTDAVSFVEIDKEITPFESRYSMGGLFKIGLGKAFYSTDFPLRFLAVIGATMALVNFVLGVFFLYKKYIHKIEVPGYTSLIVSILFSTGLLLFGIGILATYLRKVLLKMNHAPTFHIQEIIE